MRLWRPTRLGSQPYTGTFGVAHRFSVCFALACTSPFVGAMAVVETLVAFASCPFPGEFCFFHGIVLLSGAVGRHVLFVGVCRFAAGKAADSEYAGGNCFPDAAVQAGLVV